MRLVSGVIQDSGRSVTTTTPTTTRTGTLTLNSGNFDLRSGTVSAKLGGTAGLAKTTTGTVTLSGDNSYQGLTTVGRLSTDAGGLDSGGWLDISSASALGSTAAGTVLKGESFNSGLRLYGGRTFDAEPLTIRNSSSLRSISGANTWAGTIDAGRGGSSLIYQSSTGKFTLTGSITLNGSATRGANFQITSSAGAAGELEISGNISGPGRLSLNPLAAALGTQKIILSGAIPIGQNAS